MLTALCVILSVIEAVPLAGCVNVKAHVCALVSVTFWRVPFAGSIVFAVVHVPREYSALVSIAVLAATLLGVMSGVDPRDSTSVPQPVPDYAAALTGEDNADEMRITGNGQIAFLSNHAGGVLGGISTGQTIVARMALKPTSSILTPRRSVNTAGEEVDVRTTGRHDPCVGIRAVPVAEAMIACALADAKLRHRAQVG